MRWRIGVLSRYCDSFERKIRFMAKKVIYPIVAVIGIALASGAAWWYQKRSQPTASAPGSAAAPAALPVVDVVKVEVRKGAASLDGSAPSFVCICSHWINSPQEFQAAMAKHGAEIMGDIPNFTNMQPILQLDEVLT